MGTAFEPLNRSLETLLTRLSKTSESSEKSKRIFKKPRCYKDESDGCFDTWIEVMYLHFEEEDLTERLKCSGLTSNLEGTTLNCVMIKIFEILLNRFGSVLHQAMMCFEKRRQREDETIDKFLDDLEMLRRRSQPDESNRRMNLALASKFIDGVKNDGLRTMLATHFTPLSTNAPTPEEMRLKSKEYLFVKPHRDLAITKTIIAILTMDQLTRVTIGTNQGTTWTREALVQIAVRRTIMCQHAQPTNRT